MTTAVRVSESLMREARLLGDGPNRALGAGWEVRRGESRPDLPPDRGHLDRD